MRRVIKVKLRPLLLAIIFLALICENIITKYIGVASYFDEALAIILFVEYIIHIMRKGITKKDALILSIIVLLFIIGFVGNGRSRITNNLAIEMFDAFNIFKFALAILGGKLLLNEYKFKKEVVEYLGFFIKCLIIVSTVFMIVNLFFDIGMHTDYRYGFRSYNFIFTRVGDFYSSCILWILVLTAELYYKDKRNAHLFIALALINMCSTMRSRAWGFSILYVILYYAFVIRKERRFKWWHAIPFGLLVYFIAADQFSFYFSGDRARNVLLRYGLVTARNYFPFGSGFATYGTAIAQRYYSSLYDQYNFSSYWGLSSSYGSFLTDNYWPAVMAEFGFIGAIIMAVLIYLLIKKVAKGIDNKYSKINIYFGFGTLIISSLASSSFFSCTTLVVLMCLVSTLSIGGGTESLRR